MDSAFTADAELSLLGGERVVRIADLIAGGSEWRIARRAHHTLRQYDAESVVPHPAGEPAVTAEPRH